ncbi:NUDIX domain-containing protein [Oceaniglobus trochenteri]|uniref:NUDIX domain-containing protein n=1 Tax=Oceaniglobus trochenteri TaxID=2763260 RepID=UPI001D001713|nr:NUDIX domain-containing protein [Oceaniglobus trochenteri]
MANDNFRLRGQTVLADGFTRLSRFEFELRRRDGTWQRMDREVFERGHGVCCLLYDPETGTVVLTRQFRVAVEIAGDDGMMIEAPAGHLDGATPRERMQAELEEETGYRISDLYPVGNFYMTPGSVSAYQRLYLGRYSAADRVAPGGGLREEGEDIAVLHLPLTEALDMVADGRIQDGKTVILLQALALRLARGEGAFGAPGRQA